MGRKKVGRPGLIEGNAKRNGRIELGEAVEL